MPNSSANLKSALVLFLVVGFVISILPIIALIDPNNSCIKGDPSSFDPIGQYETVKHYAGGDDLDLVSILINYVKRDGTLDLYAAYEPRVIYKFYKPITIEESKDTPLGTETNRPVYKLVTVTISKPYQFELWTYKPGSTKGTFHLGMSKESYDVSVQPKKSVKPSCSIKKLWDNVLELDKKVPKNAVAVITYTDRGFRFSIKDTKYHHRFDPAGNFTK
jgi:hypothetical protein